MHQIYSIMQAGGRFGMQTMDQSLADLVKAGKVSQQLAYERCHDAEELNRLIGGSGASYDGGYGAAAVGRCRARQQLLIGRRCETMPQTYEYKVRDRTGELVTGSSRPTARRWSSQRLREMG